mgnify:CR=1 FL=1
MDNKKKAIEQLKAARETLTQYKQARLGASTASAPEAKNFKAGEIKACSKWGVKSFDELIQLNTGSRQFKAMSHEDRENVRSLKEACDIAVMSSVLFKKPLRETAAYSETIVPALKAFGINSGEVGYEWIPTAVSESYIDEYNLDRKVAALFTEIKMPSNPYKFPILSNGAIGRKLGENVQQGTKDQFASSAITFNAVKISNQYEIPEEITEDSAVDVMKVIRQELMEGQEKAMEIAILEGDTAVTHQHTNTQIPGASGAPAADSSERLFDGLRKRAIAGSLTVDCAGPADESKLSLLRQKLKKFGVNPSELALIAGVRGYNQLMQLDDVRTLEQYGPQAPVLSGELAKYEGIPVIVSEWLREDTDSTGVNGATALNNVKASMILVNRKRFMCGLRRAIVVRVENNRTAFDAWDMVSYARKAFDGVLKADGSNAASETSVALLKNIT